MSILDATSTFSLDSSEVVAGKVSFILYIYSYSSVGIEVSPSTLSFTILPSPTYSESNVVVNSVNINFLSGLHFTSLLTSTEPEPFKTISKQFMLTYLHYQIMFAPSGSSPSIIPSTTQSTPVLEGKVFDFTT